MINFISHSGVKRKSGRYPWGSGENPFQHEPWFEWRKNVFELRDQGLSEKDLIRALNERLGMSMKSHDFRAQDTIYKNEQTRALIAYAQRLREKGWSHEAIAKRIGKTEGTVRNYLKPGAEEKTIIINTTAEKLKQDIKDHKYIDIGAGVEANMGISKEKLRAAVALLEAEGYRKYTLHQRQMATGNITNVDVLGVVDPKKSDKQNWADAQKALKDGIYIPSYSSKDGGRTFKALQKPVNIDSKRIEIRYGDEGGSDKDGIIEIRRGAEDLNMGDRLYCQARIAVDGTHYLKGMVVYADDLPKGVDIRFNTNKPSGTAKMDVLKEQSKTSETNPFGASFRQHEYVDKNGKTRLSAINIVNAEEDWGKWKKSLSSQMLSKQRPAVAQQQLKLQEQIRESELKDIMRITNPLIKQKLLRSFADSCESDAVHLQAAAMPGQRTHVILGDKKIKENEIYAPNYNNGDRVVLIRHPHGGVFEIPELTVNNRNPVGKKMIDRTDAAVVINPKVAKVLSGADFDGDTVLVIPNNKGLIKRESPLKQLESFDPQTSYPGGKKVGLKEVGPKTSAGQDGFNKQREMGKISNLITDMTIKGADRDEIARAVRHSMVVIDAEKHQLDWKTSEKDNRIAELYANYQGKSTGGASTIISRSKKTMDVDVRDPNKIKIDPKTGNVEYVSANIFAREKDKDGNWRIRRDESGNPIYNRNVKRVKNEDGQWVSAIDKNGNPIVKKEKAYKIIENEDAYSMVNEKGRYRIETIYADHANAMKDLARRARKESLKVEDMKREPSAARVYANEVASIKERIRIADSNRPLERRAQALADKISSYQIKEDPAKYEFDYEARQKLRGRTLQEARDIVGAKKQKPNITNREWQAIQAGAVSKTMLSKLISTMDDKDLKELAMPRTKQGLSASQKSMAKSLWSRDYTQSEIADMLGVSVSTINTIINE